MIQIVDNKIVKIEQVEISTEITSKDIIEQLASLKQSFENINIQIEILNKDLEIVLELETKLNKNNEKSKKQH